MFDVEVDIPSLLDEVRKFDGWLQSLPEPERKRLDGEYLNARKSMGILESIAMVKAMAKQ